MPAFRNKGRNPALDHTESRLSAGKKYSN